MKVVFESVVFYHFGSTKVIRTIREDDDQLSYSKEVYFLGLKVFEVSSYQEKTRQDTLSEIWNGKSV